MALGEWSEAASVVFLFALAQLLETRAMERARGAIRALMDLAPADAVVHRDGADVRVPVDDVRVGELIVVKPGEKIPLDGTVARRREPRQRGAGHRRVAAGRERAAAPRCSPAPSTAAGRSRSTVTRLGRDSTIARIVHLVERAQAQRAPSQTFVDRFARVYTPVVLTLAVLVAVGRAARRRRRPGATWIYRSLVLLVISCPCALVISTPVSIVSALAAAARKGVLIKGGARLEQLAAVRCIAFDKTGTLTHGRLRVVDVVATDGVPAPEVLRLAASLESRSEHPIGRAIVEHAPPGAAGHRRRGRIPGAARPGRGGTGGRRAAWSSAITGCSRSAACARPARTRRSNR